jgi:hypothetical protein
MLLKPNIIEDAFVQARYTDMDKKKGKPDGSN